MNRIRAGIWAGDLLPVRLSEKRGCHYYWEIKCHCGRVFVANVHATMKRGHCGCRTIKRWDIRPPESERFLKWVKVKTGECWEWMGCRDKHGYGRYLREKAYRAAYRLFKGQIPKGGFICHTCDNPPCVNPDHLYCGTPQQNVDDCWNRGRAKKQKGAARYCAKLTDEKVREVLHRLSEGEKVIRLAKDFGVGRSAIYMIAVGARWRHVPRPEGFKFVPKFVRNAHFYDKELERRISA